MLKILEAIQIANQAHKDQKRKTDGTPYISHPVSVGILLQNARADDDVIIAGILHDVLEDTDLKKEEIEINFGGAVLELVEAVTEDKSISDWKTRKTHYLEKIKNHSNRAVLVSVADKYHNLFTLWKEGEKLKETIWEKFNAGKEKQFWFYDELCKIFEEKKGVQDLDMVRDIRILIRNIFEN